MAADVKIDIAAEFTGKKAFKQADTATQKLTSNVKKLAGAVGLAYGTSAIIAYGKASVKAFAADEAAATRLSRAVENLGIGFANPAIADYIAKLEKSASIADDILRPAFQGLLTTTGSLTQSQKLLNDAIQISRASGIDLATVTQDLGKGYVGVTRGLIKYNTGLTRAELNTMSFNDILSVILKKSAGAAEDYLDTTAYKFDVLSIATNNASEIIGGGLVDAFALVGGGKDASDAAYVIESIATALAKVTVQSGRTIGVIPTLIQNLKNLPRQIFEGFAGKQFGMNINIPNKVEEAKLTLTEKKQQELLAKMEKEALRREKERLALLNKQNTAKKLQGVIDKANLALGKGSDVFDLDKIQIAAALTNQAEQLGKATSAAQVLQIANDTARLNVKRSILALEEAIASKDEAAIVAATNKLNADLKVLGALGQQNVKLLDIKSILESLMPKDLINLDNLNEALRLLGLINLAATGSKTTPIGKTPTPAPSTTGLVPATTIAETNANVASLGGVITQIQPNLKEFTPNTGMISGISPNGREFNFTVNVNTGIGDPNAIAEAVTQVIQDAVDRGTLRGGAY
jgi:nucleotide-binding universal stress UspA family protein